MALQIVIDPVTRLEGPRMPSRARVGCERSTHAFGQMPLSIQLVAADGTVVAHVSRD